MDRLRRLFGRSLLLRLGIAMSVITLLALAAMASSALVAETTQGSAAAINLSGTLRMQSYRLATLAMAPAAPDRAPRLQAALAHFQRDLRSPVIRSALPARESAPAAAHYRRVVDRWEHELRPRLLAVARGETSAEQSGLLRHTEAFVRDADALVGDLEVAAERNITVLRTILGVAMFVTLAVVFITMYLANSDVVLPLRELLETAARIGRGDLKARTAQTGEDELGMLGLTLNGMADELERSHAQLEQRVREKTADLKRSNRSLELLYHSIARLYSGPVEPATYRILLKDIESVLGLGHGSACLVEQEGDAQARMLANTLQPGRGELDLCAVSTCAECMACGDLVQRPVPGSDKTVLALPLRDMEHQYGVMQLEMPPGQVVEAWQRQLLDALCRHIGIAIGTARRVEQRRLLTVMQERATMARELHDSLAQSLSYMKIQVSRLHGALDKGEVGHREAEQVLGELRDGLNGAYRQLRELLTTFRLKVAAGGLAAALQGTVEEFSGRGAIPIALETHLGDAQLSPHQEIHVLQIVREALANVLHHAGASEAKVCVESLPEGMLQVRIEDDGVGIATRSRAVHHYGMAIMEERARTLGGRLDVRSRPTGGTRVEVRFPAAREGRVPRGIRVGE